MNTEQSSVLAIVATERRLDKNQRPYHYIQVQKDRQKTIKLPSGTEIVAAAEPVRGVINAWEQRYLDDKPDFAASMGVGQFLLGDIVTKNVKPYFIPDRQDARTEGPAIWKASDGDRYAVGTRGRWVSTYTTTVLGDTTEKEEFQRNVEQAFRRANHEIVSTPISVVVLNGGVESPAEPVATQSVASARVGEM